MMHVQRVVVAAVIINCGKALILKRSSHEDIYPNMWELPSGKVNFGEDPNTSVKREVFEETGQEVEVVRPFYVTHYSIEKPDVKRHTIQIFYLVKRLSDDVAESLRMAFNSLKS
jgi:8-oxo-dGTP diphosphatase